MRDIGFAEFDTFAMCLGGTGKARPFVFIDAGTGFIFNYRRDSEALRILWVHIQ